MDESMWLKFKRWLCYLFDHNAFFPNQDGDIQVCKRCDRLLSTRYSRAKHDAVVDVRVDYDDLHKQFQDSKGYMAYLNGKYDNPLT